MKTRENMHNTTRDNFILWKNNRNIRENRMHKYGVVMTNKKICF